MTESEKRKFIERVHAEASRDMARKADELNKLAIVCKMSSLFGLIAPVGQLDKLYEEAAKVQAITASIQIADALAAAARATQPQQ